MALNADTLLDRIYLKNQARRWRAVAFFAGLMALLVFAERYTGIKSALQGDHIARVTIEDVIYDDTKRHQMLQDIAEDDHVKAVILRVDSPGGTTVGANQIFQDLRRIAKDKPIVCTMRTYAASGGYLAAIGADYIFADEGTLTGSIGVILQTAEVTKLIEKIGINPVTVRTGELKAAPSPFETFTAKQRLAIEKVIGDFFNYFLETVKSRRKLKDEQVNLIRDGRVVSAREALKLGLIDAIGDEQDALNWLEKQHEISTDMEVIDAKPEEEAPAIEDLVEHSMAKAISSFFKENALVKLDGLSAIWQPALLH